jgi:hypothetical protein
MTPFGHPLCMTFSPNFFFFERNIYLAVTFVWNEDERVFVPAGALAYQHECMTKWSIHLLDRLVICVYHNYTNRRHGWVISVPKSTNRMLTSVTLQTVVLALLLPFECRNTKNTKSFSMFISSILLLMLSEDKDKHGCMTCICVVVSKQLSGHK